MGQTDAVVTGDRDLLVLQTHQAIAITRPAELGAGLKPAEEER